MKKIVSKKQLSKKITPKKTPKISDFWQQLALQQQTLLHAKNRS